MMEVATAAGAEPQFTTYALDMRRRTPAWRRPQRGQAAHASTIAHSRLATGRRPALAGAARPRPPRHGRCCARASTPTSVRPIPAANRDANTDGVMGHIVEGLVAFREDTSIGPMLAEARDVRRRQDLHFHVCARASSSITARP